MAADPEAEVVQVVFEAQAGQVGVGDERVDGWSAGIGARESELDPPVGGHGDGDEHERREGDDGGCDVSSIDHGVVSIVSMGQCNACTIALRATPQTTIRPSLLFFVSFLNLLTSHPLCCAVLLPVLCVVQRGAFLKSRGRGKGCVRAGQLSVFCARVAVDVSTDGCFCYNCAL